MAVIKTGTESEFDDNYKEQAFKINPGKVNMTHGGSSIQPSTIDEHEQTKRIFSINSIFWFWVKGLHAACLHTSPRLRDRSCCQASPNFSQISAFQDGHDDRTCKKIILCYDFFMILQYFPCLIAWTHSHALVMCNKVGTINRWSPVFLRTFKRCCRLLKKYTTDEKNKQTQKQCVTTSGKRMHRAQITTNR